MGLGLVDAQIAARAGHPGEVVAGEELAPQVHVGGGGEAGVEAAGLLQGGAPHERVARHPDHVQEVGLRPEGLAPGDQPGGEHAGRPAPEDATVLVDEPPRPGDDRGARVGVEQRDGLGQVRRVQPVVGRQKLDLLAAGELEAAGEVAEQADVALVAVRLDPLAVAREHRGRVVLGGVVDHDQLEVPVLLREHAVDRPREEAPVVVRRDADADGRGHVTRSSHRLPPSML